MLAIVFLVAEQRASYLFGKSPKLCGWKIYIICHTSYFASLVLALLLNTSRSFTLLRIILPGLYSGDPLVSFDTQPIEDQHGEQQRQESSPPPGVLGDGPSGLFRPRGSPF